MNADARQTFRRQVALEDLNGVGGDTDFLTGLWNSQIISLR